MADAEAEKEAAAARAAAKKKEQKAKQKEKEKAKKAAAKAAAADGVDERSESTTAPVTKAKPGEKKKGPSKLVAEIKKAQEAARAEEERLKREEEERIRREEEAERLAKEKEEKEKERKRLKKLKEKEKILQQKKDGTYMTAKQKERQRLAQEKLRILQEQGLAFVGKDVPKTEVKSKKPVSNGSSQEKESPREAPESEEESEEEVDDVVDNWETIIDEPKTTTEVKLKPVSKKAEQVVSKMNKLNMDDETAPPPPGSLRSPIICVLGHVDTGKTKLLDYLRKSHVQDNEAGGITQQIGATFVPPTAIHEQSKGVKKKQELKMPGLLIIDTPGHESFTNLRSRGSSLCDIAILVIDIMHGLEPQTIESLNLLKARKTPFVVALNKIDRLYSWNCRPGRDVEDVIKSQETNTKLEFEKRAKEVITQLNEEGLNAALFFENPNQREYVSLVPTSAHSGDGMGNLINLIIDYTQNLLSKRITYNESKLEATVLEVKAIPGLGTTIDVILVNGFLKEGDRIVLAGHDGPIVTHIRSLLVPHPLKEIRVKCPFKDLKIVYGSVGVKITGHDLESAVAGLELHVARKDADVEDLKQECWDRFGKAMKAIKCSDKGVHVQASTLGSLEALLEFLKQSKIPYSGVRIGPVVKRDVVKASTMLESSPDHAVILAFDVKVEKDAQQEADKLGVRIFTAEIIYHLFDQFTKYQDELKMKKKEQFRHLAVFPCKLRILPQFIFNARDPIVVGVSVEDGLCIPGTPIAVPARGKNKF